jgi:methylated-DNA-[protein]-cysteine S-methyltransferase
MLIERSRIESPLGPIALVVADGHLHALEFIDSDSTAGSAPADAGGWIAGRVRAYFAGEVAALDEIPVAPAGTPFQRRVWDALRRIRVGQTRTYLQIAVELGAPAATRAVGAAIGRNPIALVVPCHRVIASSGALHGYGGGLWRKEWLLRHEGALSAEQRELFARPGAPLDPS